MNMNRRHLAGSAIAVGLALAGSASAATSDEAAVTKNTEGLRAALFAADAKALDTLCAAQLSYGHSDGHVEDKSVFIANATNGKSKFSSLAFQDTTVRVVGTSAIARFHWVGESESDGKKSATNLGVLTVWQKQGAKWKLLARQACKL
jgi:ketosteroid isomerase-like protein